jgi:hypothetical protein
VASISIGTENPNGSRAGFVGNVDPTEAAYIGKTVRHFERARIAGGELRRDGVTPPLHQRIAHCIGNACPVRSMHGSLAQVGVMQEKLLFSGRLFAQSVNQGFQFLQFALGLAAWSIAFSFCLAWHPVLTFSCSRL